MPGCRCWDCPRSPIQRPAGPIRHPTRSRKCWRWPRSPARQWPRYSPACSPPTDPGRGAAGAARRPLPPYCARIARTTLCWLCARSRAADCSSRLASQYESRGRYRLAEHRRQRFIVGLWRSRCHSPLHIQQRGHAMCDACVIETVKARMLSRRHLFRGAGAASVAAAAAATVGPAPAALAQPATSLEDMTHELGENFPTYFGEQQFFLEHKFNFANDGMNLNEIRVNEHTGTHIDAPLHFSEIGQSVAQIPVTNLIVPLCVIDIR